MKDKTIKRNKSFFTKAKKNVVFEKEIYPVQEVTYDFFCPKCRVKFNSNVYKYAVAVNGNLNILTKHVCDVRCHRFIKADEKIVEKLFLESNKTFVYYPKQKKMKDAYKKRGYVRRTKNFTPKEEFEI